MIWLVECPRIICNVLGFMPLSMHLVANVCRSVCGDNGLNCGSFNAILLKIYFITTVVFNAAYISCVLRDGLRFKRRIPVTGDFNRDIPISRFYSFVNVPIHSLIKREWLNRFTIRNCRHAYSLVFEYIETFYNTVRIHSHCDYMSPNDYEKLYMRIENLSAA